MASKYVYPLVNKKFAKENGPFIMSLPNRIVIFHSYVKLPESISISLASWYAGLGPVMNAQPGSDL